ncbi:hypothetical protein NL108_012712 [Boleophthalmus pectinirostris]|uniref:inner centromere protein A-like n=1 Tax=Boleophthalmus pectinirostris TaxID=150288 RepID=UPI00242DE0E7|nr:inner centromere protein A-like [Boleophthalmus pectinirostris]KAJ0055206.1 hypothetical protein NL108_012712 [Boleophthalmus pectinirostris]
MASPGPLAPPQVVLWEAFLGLESQGEPLEPQGEPLEPHGEPLEPHGEPLEELRSIVSARLAAAVEDILLAVEKTVARYRHEFDRQKMQRAGVEVKEEPPGASGGVADQPLKLEQIQITEAMGPVKEEQILVNISHTFVKEEPGTFPLSAQFPGDAIKEETQEIQAFPQRHHKLEEPEEEWHILLRSKTQPDQNQDPGLNQDLNQDQGLNPDLEQDCEESMEWNFEGLYPGGRSTEGTEHSSEKEPIPKRGTARPDHCNIATLNLDPKVQLNGAMLNQLPLNHATQNQQKAAPLDSGDEVTENSSDFSDSETERSKSVNERSFVMTSQRCVPAFKGEKKAEKRKKLNRRMTKKGEKVVAVKESGADASHTSATYKRMVDWQQKVTPPCPTPPGQTTPRETLPGQTKPCETSPCPVCGKSFTTKRSLSRHLRAHANQSRKEGKKEREATRGGADKSRKAEEKKRGSEIVQKRQEEDREKGRERTQGSNKKRKRQKTRGGVEESEKKGGEGVQKRAKVEEMRVEEMREERARGEERAREERAREERAREERAREERSRQMQRMETDNETDTDQTRDSSDEN